MKTSEQKRALRAAVAAARAAGQLLRQQRNAAKKVQAASRHDLKLELDLRCQHLIEDTLQSAFPALPMLGEEGTSGDPEALRRWVVDPIDGTVNYAYGIPHACVSIALQEQGPRPGQPFRGPEDFETLVGVVYDPFCDELWTARRGGRARLNDRVIQVSRRNRLDQTIVSLGFAKQDQSLKRMLPTLNRLIHQVRKIRIMGAAALGLVYVASGRLDAYLEFGLRLWDIAAGGLILECAGGEFWRRALPGRHTFEVIATNGLLRQKLRPRS